jgi:hypothetical protein
LYSDLNLAYFGEQLKGKLILSLAEISEKIGEYTFEILFINIVLFTAQYWPPISEVVFSQLRLRGEIPIKLTNNTVT